MKKSLLYIGNALSSSGNTITVIESLSKKLVGEGFVVTIASSRKNKITRLLDMAFTVFKNRKKVDCALVDTYSTQNFWYAVVVATLCRWYQIPYIPMVEICPIDCKKTLDNPKNFFREQRPT